MKHRFRISISFQVSIFLIIVAFIPVVVMMALNTYEKQQLAMVENSNVQQGRLMAAALSDISLDAERAADILKKMNNQFDSRIRILDSQRRLICDSSTMEEKTPYVIETSSRSIKKEVEANRSFLYRVFSYPIRLYRRWFRPPATNYYGHADFYIGNDVFDGQEIYEALEGKYGAKTRISSGTQVSVNLYSALPIFSSNESGEVIGVVLVSRSTYKILQNLYELRLELAKIFFRSLIVVIIIAVFLSIRISFPLKKLSKQTVDCADKKGKILFTDFSGKKRRDEIGDLSRSFTALIERLNKRIKFSQAFSSDISHEFKNPLAAIRTSAEVLTDESLDIKDRNELTEAIIDEVDHLQTLLNGVRNISKIDAGDAFYENNLTPLPVNTYINSIIKKMENKYQNVSFVLDSVSDDVKFLIPEDYLYRISENLIDNAASFGTKVKITVKRENTKNNEKLILTVQDNGKGVSEEAKTKIFDRFYSERNTDSDNHTGLGLSIVKSIVDTLEGELTVTTSEELGGALFKIELNNTISQ